MDFPDAAEMHPHADAGERLHDAEIRFRGEMQGPESVAFDPCGRVPYTGVADGRVLVWDGVRKQGEGDRRRDAEAAADLPSSPIPVLLLRCFALPPAAAPPPPPHPRRVTTLASAEQHNCLQLKMKYVEFIVSTPRILDAVLATNEYKHLEASCPMGQKGLKGKTENLCPLYICYEQLTARVCTPV